MNNNELFQNLKELKKISYEIFNMIPEEENLKRIIDNEKFGTGNGIFFEKIEQYEGLLNYFAIIKKELGNRNEKEEKSDGNGDEISELINEFVTTKTTPSNDEFSGEDKKLYENLQKLNTLLTDPTYHITAEGGDTELFEKLRLLRNLLTPYNPYNSAAQFMASNETLQMIVDEKPLSKNGLLQIKGIKEKKFEEYGLSILQVIKLHYHYIKKTYPIDDTILKLLVKVKPSSVDELKKIGLTDEQCNEYGQAVLIILSQRTMNREEKKEIIKTKFPNYGNQRTEEDDAKLKEYYLMGVRLPKLVEYFGRPKKNIKERLVKLGLVIKK